MARFVVLALVLLPLTAHAQDRAPIDLDGSGYRAALREGRRHARAGRCDAAREPLTRAMRSRHDDGWAIAELVWCARRLEDDELMMEASSWMRGARDHGARAAVAYELGRWHESQDAFGEALDAYLQSHALRPRPAAWQAAVAVDRRVLREYGEHLGLSRIGADRLEPSEAPCDGADDCQIVHTVEGHGARYQVVRRREAPPETFEIEGRVFQADEGSTGLFLYVGARGGWWRLRLAEEGGVGLAGTSWTTEVAHARATQLVRGGPSELVLELEDRDVDYDWCDSYWNRSQRVLACGLDDEGAVCWLRASVARQEWVGLGRIGFGELDPEDAAMCGLEPRLRSAEELQALMRPPALEPRFAIRANRGRLVLRGAPPPALAAVSDIRELPCLLHAEGFTCPAAPAD